MVDTLRGGIFHTSGGGQGNFKIDISFVRLPNVLPNAANPYVPVINRIGPDSAPGQKWYKKHTSESDRRLFGEIMSSDLIKDSEKKELTTYLSILIGMYASTAEPFRKKLRELDDKRKKRRKAREAERTSADLREVTKSLIEDALADKGLDGTLKSFPGGAKALLKLKVLGGVPLFLAGQYATLALDKDDRNRVYRTLYAQLQDEIRRKGRNSPRAQAILEGMGMLPQLGAKRANFRRAYIENPVGWRSLPRDPDDIPYGHWH